MSAQMSPQLSPPADAGTRHDRKGLPPAIAVSIAALRRSGVVVPFVVLFAVLSFASPAFATGINLANILDQQASIVIIACAGTVVFLVGGLDLSFGATYTLAAVITADLAKNHNVIIALVVGLAVGTFVGFVNGVLVTFLEINALIVTLATSFVIAGLASLLTSGDSITLYDNDAYGKLAGMEFLGLTSAVWIMIVFAIVIGLVLWATPYGRHVYAVGGNASAARLAGLRVPMVKISAFTLSGFAAALGGLIDSSRVLSAQAADANALTFTVIAGIVVGGTSLAGGEGVVWRTVVGVLFLALVGNGYNLLGADPLYQRITLGVLILLAVGVGRLGRYVGQGANWGRRRLGHSSSPPATMF